MEGALTHLFLGFDFKLVIDFIFARNLSGLTRDCVLLLLASTGPFKVILPSWAMILTF